MGALNNVLDMQVLTRYLLRLRGKGGASMHAVSGIDELEQSQ
jgi:hypothetical protein